MSDDAKQTKLDMARAVILEDRERREKAAAEKIQAVLQEYHCQQIILPGEATLQPGGVWVIGPPSLGIRALEN